MSKSTASKREPSGLSRVYFDVSGTIFWTRPDTLKNSTKLTAIYQDRVRHTHSDGSIDGQSASLPIRIDRNATEFGHVLGYLQDERYPIEPDWEYALQYYGCQYDGLFEDVDSSDNDSGSDSDDSVFTDDDSDSGTPERGRSRERQPPPAPAASAVSHASKASKAK